MKKSILAIAVIAASVAAPAAMAAPTVYGNVHLSIASVDSNDRIDGKDSLTMNSNTSAIGVKGSEDLGDGLKAIYKLEFGVNVLGKVTDEGPNSSNGALTGRDQFVGLKGGMGTVKFGTFSSNYKQMGGKVDSLYRTPVEGRGFIHTQSNLHGGRGINRGRMTNNLQYSSPKMAGVQLVANATISNSEEETTGVGVRYATKDILVYADFIDTQPGAATGGVATTESAFKVGGKFSTKAFHVALQYEAAEDVTGFDYIHANAGFNINANNSVQLTAGTASAKAANADTTGFAVAYVHSLSKMTMLYAAYGDHSSDVANSDASAFALGIRKKF